ncbi:hypothetical protein M3795_14075 [Ralstonia pickettii]|uniref:hypothetical protein n=1 Tax=Ralstonia pickettii TaxID=329 RepID=UPI002041216F|nr:hypothetical protein [Ralstonia pickettii]MCM3581613.1 hypothetical protein [Ralstonia pickettii]
MVGYKVIDPEMLKALTTPMKTANLQYLYIARSAGATSVGRFFFFDTLKRKRAADCANEKGPTVACRAFQILVGRE